MIKAVGGYDTGEKGYDRHKKNDNIDKDTHVIVNAEEVMEQQLNV